MNTGLDSFGRLQGAKIGTFSRQPKEQALQAEIISHGMVHPERLSSLSPGVWDWNL